MFSIMLSAAFDSSSGISSISKELSSKLISSGLLSDLSSDSITARRSSTDILSIGLFLFVSLTFIFSAVLFFFLFFFLDISFSLILSDRCPQRGT